MEKPFISPNFDIVHLARIPINKAGDQKFPLSNTSAILPMLCSPTNKANILVGWSDKGNSVQKPNVDNQKWINAPTVL